MRMNSEFCSLTQKSGAPSRPFTARRVATAGLQCSSSFARLLRQRHPCDINTHTSAADVDNIPQRRLSSQASVAEAPTQAAAIDTQHADKSAKSSSDKRKSQKPSSSDTSASHQSQLESLGLLEWPELCQQVSECLQLVDMHGMLASVMAHHMQCYQLHVLLHGNNELHIVTHNLLLMCMALVYCCPEIVCPSSLLRLCDSDACNKQLCCNSTPYRPECISGHQIDSRR